MPEQGRAGEAIKRMIAGGLVGAFNQEIGAPANATAQERRNFLGRWIDDKKSRVGQTAKEAFVEALEDDEVQARGADYVKHTLQETVGEAKNNFPTILSTAADKLRTNDNRDNYTKMKAILGADKGRWYMKLLKRCTARVFAFGMPVLGYVSGSVAGEFTGRTQEVRRYRENFNSVYDHLLSRIAPQPQAQGAR